MSCFDVKILDPNINTIEIETCIGDQPASIDVVTYDNTSLIEVNHCIALLPSEISELIKVQDILAGSGINVISSSGIYTISLLNPIISSTNIVDLLEAVQDIIGNSGLLAGNYININYNDSTGFTTITATGLQPSGNYSVVGHQHLISDVSGLQLALDNKQPSGNYAPLIHNHISSDITDFNSSVSGLLPSVSGNGYVNSSFNNNIYVISVTGLQPSGNYSIVGHSHTSNDISDFNNAVSGLLPVKNITAGSGIGIVSTSGDFTVSVTGTFGLTSEQVDDRVSQLLVPGSYINLNYNDNLNSLTVSVTGLQPSGNYANANHTHTTSDITNFNSSVSGLLPTIANSGNNRVLTSDGTSTGINAESYLTFDNNTATLNVGSSGMDNNSSNINLYGRSSDDQQVGISIKNSNSNLQAEFYWNGDEDSTVLASYVDKLILSAPVFDGGVSVSTDVLNMGGYGSSGIYISTTNNLFVNNIPVSVSGHTHSSSDITNFNSSVSGLLPSVSGSGYVNSSFNNNIYTISVSGLQPSGNYANANHTHTTSDITDFSSSVSGLLPTIANSGNNRILTSDGTKYGINAESNLTFDGSVLSIKDPTKTYYGQIHLFNSDSGDESAGLYIYNSENQQRLELLTNDDQDINFLVSNGYPLNIISYSGPISCTTYGSGLFVDNIRVSVSGHTHLSSDITNFNSSVSGLLPVKDILAGSGISVSSTSGAYTISANISGVILEAIQDNLGSGFLIAGTGVQLNYNDSANTLTLNNLHTEINELSLEPQGFVNRLDSTISFNDSTRTFTIAPTGTSYDVYIEGVKVTKTISESIVIGSGTALNYLHFNTDTGLLDNKTTGFDFDTDVPIAYIHWNADINQSTFFGEERHGIRMDSSTHKWIHNTFGMQYIRGLSIGNYVLLGDGSSNSHAQIDISDGILYQEDIIIDITNDNGINSANEFVQTLNPIAYIPTYYHSGSTGQWVRDIATAFPVKYNATRAQYNLFSGGTWTTPNVTNDRFFAMWIVATNDINDPILAIVGQRQDSSLNSAESNNNWNDINLTNIPTQEIRPLYRLIFKTNSTYTNTPKSSLQSILDIRVAIQSTVAGVVQNDHGSLFGLADDDHSQYVHIDNNRTISALHTFSNGLNAGGLINATSGNFTSLTVNSTGVSLNGHTHTSSNITDFNSSVSGLLPSVSGSGYVSSSFDNNIYTISVTGLQPSGNYSLVGHNHTSNDITDFNSSVSGLLPVTNIVGGTNVSVSASGTVYTISASGTGTTITNASDNRVLTSTGTSTGINAENNLTFDGTNLVITGNIGIGTGVLSEKLEVAGNIKANNIIHPFLLGGM